MGFFLGKELCSSSIKGETLRETVGYSTQNIYKRIKKNYLVYVISCVIAFAVKAIGENWTAFGVAHNFLMCPTDLLFLQSFGVPSLGLTGTAWFLSSMIVAMWLLYPIARRNHILFSHYLAPVISLMIIGSLITEFGSLNVPHERVLFFIDTGVLRAIAAISLGITVFEVNKWIDKKVDQERDTTRNALACVCFFSVLLYQFSFQDGWGANDGLAVIVLAIGLAIKPFEKGKEYAPKTIEKVCFFLGKLSVVVYMKQFLLDTVNESADKKAFWSSTIEQQKRDCCHYSFPFD